MATFFPEGSGSSQSCGSASDPYSTAARLTADLINAGFCFKDLKPSNILIGDAGEAWLIDVGSARRARTRADLDRTLAVMTQVLARAWADDVLRQRFGDAVRRTVTR